MAPPGKPSRARETLAVFLLLALLHALLWARGLPLPHQDFLFYLEPAFHLAREGRLIAPGAEYVDLTYTLSFGFYPPGYFLTLGPWIFLFGADGGDLRAFIHTVHLLYLTALFYLLRARFAVSRPIAALALVSAFPFYNYGRPDLVAVLFSACAWIAAPTSDYGARFWLATTLAALSLLTSPAFGLGCVATIVTFLALPLGRWSKDSLRRAALFGVTAPGIMLAVWAAVITAQGAWSTVPSQFHVNAMLRGAELNVLPAWSTFVLVFSVLPLFLATIVPAVAVLAPRSGLREHPVWIAAAAYLTAFVAIFATNRMQLLGSHHFGLVQRPVLHATLSETKRPWRFVGIGATVLFALIHAYLQKEDLVAAFAGGLRYERIDPSAIASARVIAVDSTYAPLVYGRVEKPVLDYHMIKVDYWRRYRDATPKRLLLALPERLRNGPDVPDLLLVSTRGLLQSGPPNPAFFERVSGADPERLRLFGHELKVTKDPLALHVYRRRAGVPVPEHL